METYKTKLGNTLRVERTDQHIRVYIEGISSPIFDANIAHTEVSEVDARMLEALRMYGVELPEEDGS